MTKIVKENQKQKRTNFGGNVGKNILVLIFENKLKNFKKYKS
jgi:hypothetical protein